MDLRVDTFEMLLPKFSEVVLRSLTVVSKAEVTANHFVHGTYLLRVGNSVIVRQPVLYEMVASDFPESPIHNFTAFMFLASACA